MLTDVQEGSLGTSDTNKADVREDEEQQKKFQDIIDLLLAAGYFRARIKGLSDFDKVIGGMTWCIESSNFDIDIDLLFRENLTIGSKLSLAEKIVAMISKMNCPYQIQPHQILCLDCIHIFSVIQWLVKRSMETREKMADSMRSFALYQFHKMHSFTEDTNTASAIKENTIKNIRQVKKSYEPRRLFKHKDGSVRDESTRFLGTILEYEAPLYYSVRTAETPSAPSNDTEGNGNKEEPSIEKKKTEELAGTMSAIEESAIRTSTVGNFVGIQAQEVAKVAKRYLTPFTSEEEEACQQQKLTLENRIKILTQKRDALSKEIVYLNEETNKMNVKRKKIEDLFEKAQKEKFNENDSTYKRLQALSTVGSELKSSIHNFEEYSRKELCQLTEMLQQTENSASEGEEDRLKEYEERKEAITQMRLQLAKKNRAIASLTRQLDDVPGRSELAQYQRRFMELYNQVSTKHKETKQYYTLYNILDDTKLYLTTELSLLNSIQDNYNEAMASASGKEQFLKQFEAIVEGVKRNKSKVERRCAYEKNKRDTFSRQLVTLIEQQRKYVAAVRQLTIECRRNEALLAQLRGS